MDKAYPAKDIIVHYNAKLCIHAAECVRGLPGVFDTSKKPWIDPSQGNADEIARVIQRCPSGALHYERLEGSAAETPSEPQVLLIQDGPMYVQGELKLNNEQGTLLFEGTRVALCRCGQSKNKPFCDRSHLSSFEAPQSMLNLI
jgi:uncharacterized Fe-S cluster protein YjdI